MRTVPLSCRKENGSRVWEPSSTTRIKRAYYLSGADRHLHPWVRWGKEPRREARKEQTDRAGSRLHPKSRLDPGTHRCRRGNHLHHQMQSGAPAAVRWSENAGLKRATKSGHWARVS